MAQIYKQKLTRWYFYVCLGKSGRQKVYFVHLSFYDTFFLTILIKSLRYDITFLQQ